MKITFYELLGLIKEGKAPKKIKYDRHIYEYEQNSLVLDDFNYYSITNGFLYNEIDFENYLNDEVEIIEEEKEIEKIKELPIKLFHNKQKILANKLNELIDVINDMRDEE